MNIKLRYYKSVFRQYVVLYAVECLNLTKHAQLRALEVQDRTFNRRIVRQRILPAERRWNKPTSELKQYQESLIDIISEND